MGKKTTMSNPKAIRDKFMRILYKLQAGDELTQNDVLVLKSIFDAGMNVLYNSGEKGETKAE